MIKRPIFIWFAVILAGFVGAGNRVANLGSVAAFSDNFNRADSDSLGANWTEAANDCDIVSNQASWPTTFDFSEKAAIYSGTACTTTTNYVKITLDAVGVALPSVIFRYTNSSSAFYELYLDVTNQKLKWYHWTAVGGTQTLINGPAGASFTFTLPVTIGVTWTGAGNSTTVRTWLTPSANAPTSATSWDGGAATVVISDDPASAVDSGGYIGMGGVSNGTLLADDFFGGDVP